jgi:hypothetical protein
MSDTLSQSGIPLLTVTRHTRSLGASTAPAPVSSSCKWCFAKGHTDQAKTHTLEQCTELDARIKHFKSNKCPAAKSKAKQSANAVTEFAGEASSSNSLTSDPAEHFWIPDSGATSNMTSHKEWIVDYIPLRLPIRLGDNSVVYSAGVGKVWFEPMLSGHSAPLVCLSRVLHVPRLKSNLLSITYLSAQQQVKVSFINSTVTIENGGLIMEASINACKIGKLLGHTLPAISIPQQAYAATLYPHDIQLWHRRLGHIKKTSYF